MWLVTGPYFHILPSSWFFHMLGYHKLSKPSLLNGVAMAFTFFLVRIAVIPGYYSHMYSVFGTNDFYRLPLGGRSAWVISSVSLDVMNIMWMRRIIRGCLKVLRSAWTRPAGTEMKTRNTDWNREKNNNNTSAHKPSILYHDAGVQVSYALLPLLYFWVFKPTNQLRGKPVIELMTYMMSSLNQSVTGTYMFFRWLRGMRLITMYNQDISCGCTIYY